jgi:uncharacterized protein (TIGR03382 family)
MKKFAFGLITIAGLASSALAQNSGAALTDGNAFYDVTATGVAGTIPTTAEPTGTATQVQSNFRMGPTNTSQDQLYANWWWYRINGTSTRELGIRQTTGTAVKSSLGANHVRYQITPATGLLFTMDFTLTDQDGAGTNAANIYMVTTFTNNTGQAVDMTLINMADLFLFGADAADRLRTATVGTDRNLLISDSGAGAAANATMMFTGYGASGYGIGTFSGISGQVTDTGIDNFADVNSGAPIEPAAGTDISAVMQFNLGSVAPGASASAYSAIAVHLNGTAQTIPTPGSIALLALGGLVAVRRRR